MPKRSAEEKINYYSNKIKKIQQKSKLRRMIVYSSSDSEDLDIRSQRSEDQNNVSCLPPRASTPLSSEKTQEPVITLNPTPDEVILPLTDIISEPAAPEIDPELLLALGNASEEIPDYGPDIHNTLAERWLPILKKGLPPDAKEKILKEYTIPSNCTLLKASTLNPEISAAVADIVKVRDKKIQVEQDQLGLGITAINRAMTSLLTNDDKVSTIKCMSDSCRILSDLHYIETQVRTKLVSRGLDKSFLAAIHNQDRDETLFGNSLSEQIKASKAIEKQGLQIKKPSVQKPPAATITLSTSRPRYQGNWPGPSHYQSSSRGGRGTSYRGQYRRTPQSTAQLPSARQASSTISNKRVPPRQ